MERKKASDYPQELLDLFHEYQHGDIDRRTFLERAGEVRGRRPHRRHDSLGNEAQLRLGSAGARRTTRASRPRS